MKLPFGLVSEKVQYAWDEYHRTPLDFARVEPFFLAAVADGGCDAKFNYAKFIGMFDQDAATRVFKELSSSHTPSMFYYARQLTLFGTAYQKRKAIALLKKCISNKHMVSKVFIYYSIFKCKNIYQKIVYAPCFAVLIITSGINCIMHQKETYEGL
jgi:hypothetical protein